MFSLYKFRLQIENRIDCVLVVWKFIYSFGGLRRSEEAFTYMTEVSTVVDGNRAILRKKPMHHRKWKVNVNYRMPNKTKKNERPVITAR